MINQSNLIRTILCIVAVALMGSLINGCKDSGTNVTGTPAVMPKTGSTYVVYEYNTDSTGAKTQEDTADVTVIASGITYGGKSNVVVFAQANRTSGARDTTYCNFESNGNISIADSSKDANNNDVFLWETYPVASGGTTTLMNIDTTVTDSSGTATVKNKGTVQLTGNEDITVNGEKLATQKLHLEITLSTLVGIIPLISSETKTDIWFSSKIGYVVKSSSTEKASFLGFSGNGGSGTMVVSYTLR